MRRALSIFVALALALSCVPEDDYTPVGKLGEPGSVTDGPGQSDNPGVPDVPEEPDEPGEIFNADPRLYTSSDFSRDGEIRVLQEATEGNGIDLVLIGDAFTDRLISSGSYDSYMRDAMEYFFLEEPFKSFRNLFNVYQIYAVSSKEYLLNPNDSYAEFTSETYSTALGSFLTANSVGGEMEAVERYLKVLFKEDPDRIDQVTVVVVCNKQNSYLGSCTMVQPTLQRNIHMNTADGRSFSYVTLGVMNIGTGKVDFASLVSHEVGHGFGKLADEYVTQPTERFPSMNVSNWKNLQSQGWYLNASFSADSSAVPWSKYLYDKRYDGTGLGVFQGCATYGLGIYRPTSNSMMNGNMGGYNVISREIIYRRIHKLAYGREWEFDYETFVDYDAVNRP